MAVSPSLRPHGPVQNISTSVAYHANERRRYLTRRCWCCSIMAVSLLILVLLGAAVARVRSAGPGGGAYAYNPLGRKQPDASGPRIVSRKDSSWMTVDPSKVLSTLVERGGLVLPTSITSDLMLLREVCAAEESMVDVLRRQLLIKNFTVSLPLQARSTTGSGEKEKDSPSRPAAPKSLPALRVGRVKVSWDSYLRPCVNVELSGVDILVEFTNLLLTRTNWHELRTFGFPPALLVWEEVASEDSPTAAVAVDVDVDVDVDNESTASASSSFIRIGSMDFSGNVTLRIVSRPLDGEDVVPPFAFGLEALDDLNERIREEADAATSSEAPGRRGCTTDAVYDIVQTFFVRKLQRLLASTAFDVAAMREDAAAVRGTRRAVSSAKEAAKKYASLVGNLAEERAKNRLGGVQRKVLDKLRRMGLNDGQIKRVSFASTSAVDGATTLLKAAFQKRLDDLSDDEEDRSSDDDERKSSSPKVVEPEL